MKKTYVIPEILVIAAQACSFSATSGMQGVREEQDKKPSENIIGQSRFNYLCPLIPSDTRCSRYNRFVRKKKGVNESPSDTPEHLRVSVRDPQDCPYSNGCKILETYRNAVDGRQR